MAWPTWIALARSRLRKSCSQLPVRYLPDTNVLITRFFAEDGVGEIQDLVPVGGAR